MCSLLKRIKLELFLSFTYNKSYVACLNKVASNGVLRNHKNSLHDTLLEEDFVSPFQDLYPTDPTYVSNQNLIIIRPEDFIF